MTSRPPARRPLCVQFHLHACRHETDRARAETGERKRTRQLISEQCAGGKRPNTGHLFKTCSSPGRISTNTTEEKERKKRKVQEGKSSRIVP